MPLAAIFARAVGLAGKVPLWVWPVLLLALWGGCSRKQYLAEREAFKTAKVQAETARAAAAAAAKEETERRVRDHKEIADAAKAQSERERAARVAADRAAVGLRARIAALQAGARPDDPHAAGSCQAATEAVDLLADVLRRADARAGELAAYAEAAATAGATCERAYDALTR